MPDDIAIALGAFAATLRPRTVSVAPAAGAVGYRGRPAVPRVTVLAGDPDEIWLKWLKIKHGAERHTPAEWRALIDQYRNLPAHPSAMGG